MAKRNITVKTLEKYKLIVDKWFTVDFNGAEAYRFYYPNVKKDATATVNFSRLSKIPEIKEYIKEKREEASKIIEINHKGILQELKNWLELDITDTIGLSKEGIRELPVAVRRLITKHRERTKNIYDKEGNLSSVEVTIELHFVSKEKAMEMINKHLGFYEIDNKQKANIVNYDSLSESTLLEIWNARNK